MKNAAHIRLVLWKAAKAVENVDRASIAATGLLISEFAILEALLHKGPLAINIIGEKVLLTSGSMTAAVNRLEKRNLVRRVQDPADGRRFLVHLTDQGRALIEEAFEQHTRNLEMILEGFTDQERDEMIRLLKKLGYGAQDVVPLGPPS